MEMKKKRATVGSIESFLPIKLCLKLVLKLKKKVWSRIKVIRNEALSTRWVKGNALY